MYSYGFWWRYGIGAVGADGEAVGRVIVFGSKRERDEWVANDVFDGNFHRDWIPAREARRIMVYALFKEVTGTLPTQVYELVRMYETRSSMYRLIPTSKLVEAWRVINEA